MENLKMLNLTEKDFNYLIDALEHLPSKDLAGEMMGVILRISLSGDDLDKEKYLKELRQKEERRKREKEGMNEDIKILQGKILMLKRFLIENKIMEDVNRIYSDKR